MEEISMMNWAIVLPIIIIQFLLTIIALVDLVRSEETNGPKILWVFVILLISMIGPILYFVIGRKR
mgnify:CR=1 FL=1